jgi:hypothetical protein
MPELRSREKSEPRSDINLGKDGGNAVGVSDIPDLLAPNVVVEHFRRKTKRIPQRNQQGGQD